MPNPKLETYKNKATDTVYDLTDANAQAMIAPEFSTSTAYVFGDYVIYEGKLYRFVANHSAGAWNSEHVSTEIEIGTNLNNKEDKVTFDSGDFNDQGVIDLTTGMGSRSVSLNKSTSPTDGDTKPITSGAVYNALTDKVDWASYAKTGAINRMPNTAVSSGIFTVNADGSIRINGTPTETAILIINDYGKWLENGKTYYLSGITGGASDTYKLDITTANSGLITATNGEISFTVNNAADYRARIVVYANKTVDTTIYPMVADSPNAPYAPYAMTNRELTEGVTNVHTFTPSNASITDFHGYYTINGKILTFVASYTKKGSSFTIGNIPNIQLASGLGESSSDVFVVGKGASGKDIIFYNQNGNLIFQEKETTDQTDKSYVQATLLLK